MSAPIQIAVIVHATILVGLGGISAYCKHDAAWHRREQQRLRDLRMFGSTDISAAAREKITIRIFRQRERTASSKKEQAPSPLASSVIVDRLLQIILSQWDGRNGTKR